MLDQSYSENNLRRLLHPADFVRYPLTNDDAWIKAKLLSTSNKVSAETINYNTFDFISKRKFDFYKCNDFDTDIVLRKLDNNIKRLYKIKQTDRTEIVKQVKTVLSDATPINIVRLDIKSFYENISKNKVLKKINNDYLLSSESKFILDKIFNNKFFKDKDGLPRGIGVSATLSEMYLRNIDKYIKRSSGVIYYARYVDDILIVSCNDGQKLIEEVEKKLTELGLELNTKKCDNLQLPAKGKALCNCVSSCVCNEGFEYLGYKFSFPLTKRNKQNKRFVSITVANSKISKIKTRLVNSFLDYSLTKNICLLDMRLKYLSGNYFIPLTKSGENLKGGIFYHYPLITDDNCLKDLTKFLRKLIFSRHGNLGAKISPSLTHHLRKYLLRYTFEGGFKKRIIHKLTPREIGEIKECWRYE